MDTLNLQQLLACVSPPSWSECLEEHGKSRAHRKLHVSPYNARCIDVNMKTFQCLNHAACSSVCLYMQV